MFRIIAAPVGLDFRPPDVSKFLGEGSCFLRDFMSYHGLNRLQMDLRAAKLPPLRQWFPSVSMTSG